MVGIVAIDFAGTLVQAGVVERANILRSEVLDTQAPTADEHASNQELYAKNRDALQALTGVHNEMHVTFRQPDGNDVQLTGRQYKNLLSSTLFGIGLLSIVNKEGQGVFVTGMLEELSRIRSLGYELAVVSGVRSDIITAVLEITGTSDLFDYVEGQPPTLSMRNEQLLRDLSDYGQIDFLIGDKLSDLDPAASVGAKAVFVTWGHPSGGEEALADHTASTPADLQDIITG